MPLDTRYVEMLAALGRRMGIPSLKFDEKYACSLIIDGDIHVDIHANMSLARINLVTALDLPLPDPLGPGLAEELLGTGFDLITEGGPALALNPQGDILVAGVDVPVGESETSDLYDILSRLLEFRDIWRTKLLPEEPETAPGAVILWG